MTAAPIILLAALSARTVTLDEAERAAEAQKPEVRVAQGAAAAGVARSEQARAPLLPQIKAEGEYDRTTGNLRQRPNRSTLVANSWTFYNWFSGQVTGTQLIWDFGRSLYGWRSAQMRAVALSDTERAARLEAVAAAREAYFRARAAKSLIGVAQQTYANMERHLVQITGFVQAGTRPEIDLAQAARQRLHGARQRDQDRERLHRRARRAEPGDGDHRRHRVRRHRRHAAAGAGRDGRGRPADRRGGAGAARRRRAGGAAARPGAERALRPRRLLAHPERRSRAPATRARASSRHPRSTTSATRS